MRQSIFQLKHQTNDLSTTTHQQVNILSDNSTATTARSEFLRQSIFQLNHQTNDFLTTPHQRVRNKNLTENPIFNSQLQQIKVNLTGNRSFNHNARNSDPSNTLHYVPGSVPDSDPQVFRPPGSGSVSQRYRSGSGSFHHQAKKKEKHLFLLFVTSL